MNSPDAEFAAELDHTLDMTQAVTFPTMRPAPKPERLTFTIPRRGAHRDDR